ncbi:MAG TPA: hypothetical protein VJS44_20095 [Pyrinomonadaceae bacterium]|nr:hypothetical protein [Pyrinomonadaceae bacterium]
MKKRIAYFLASLVLSLVATASYLAPAPAGAQGASCQAQCKVSYSTCVRNASNPGGLNQCKKAYTACLAGCN